MRTAVTIGILVALIATLYFAILKAVAKISMQISFKNFDFSSFNIGDLLSSGTSVKVQIDAKINNRNSFPIKLTDFHIWIYYANKDYN